jgi:hypothetical protein
LPYSIVSLNVFSQWVVSLFQVLSISTTDTLNTYKLATEIKYTIRMKWKNLIFDIIYFCALLCGCLVSYCGYFRLEFCEQFPLGKDDKWEGSHRQFHLKFP